VLFVVVLFVDLPPLGDCSFLSPRQERTKETHRRQTPLHLPQHPSLATGTPLVPLRLCILSAHFYENKQNSPLPRQVGGLERGWGEAKKQQQTFLKAGSFSVFAKNIEICYYNKEPMSTQTPQKLIPIRTLEREMLVASIVWVMLGALCVFAANAWAAGSL